MEYKTSDFWFAVALLLSGAKIQRVEGEGKRKSFIFTTDELEDTPENMWAAYLNYNLKINVVVQDVSDAVGRLKTALYNNTI